MAFGRNLVSVKRYKKGIEKVRWKIDKKKCSYCGHFHSSIIVNRIIDLFPPKRVYPDSILICDYCLGLLEVKCEPIQLSLPLTF